MRMLRAEGVYEFIRSGPKWTEWIEVQTNGPTRTKVDRIDQLKLNIIKVDKMDRIRLNWYRTKMDQI